LGILKSKKNKKNKSRKPGRSAPRKASAGRGTAVRILLAAIAVMVTGGLLVGAGWAVLEGADWVASHEAFRIETVSVSGLRFVKEEDLMAYAGDPTGSSIFRLDVDAMAERINTHPWVKDVSVRRELPDKVRVDVLERVPLALAVTPDGEFLVDGDGWVLAFVRGKDWDFLPSFVYEKRGGLDIGGGSSNDVAGALTLLRSVKEDKTELLAGGVVYVDAKGDPVLRYRGTNILFGRDDFEKKVLRLTDVIPDVYKRGVKPDTIDLRFPGKVVVDGGSGKIS